MTDLLTAVRMEVGDTDPNNGIMPDSKQFTEKQYQYAVEAERVVAYDDPTQIEIGRVSAKLLEMASVAWAAQPLESELGPSAQVNNTSTLFSNKAASLRRKWGFGGLESTDTGRNQRLPTYSGHGAYVLPPGVN